MVSSMGGNVGDDKDGDDKVISKVGNIGFDGYIGTCIL